jgi:F-type H+-transporting ATPase subunit epsilon
MADTFKFELVSPEKLLLSADATSVVVPGSEGYFTVMATHSALMTTMRPGLIQVSVDGKDDAFFVQGGFADVTPTSCTILAEFAVPASDIDAEQYDAIVEGIKSELDATENEDKKQQLNAYLAQLNEVRDEVIAA